MATHSSILAWRIPWTGTSKATSMGLQRIRYNGLSTHKEKNDNSCMKAMKGMQVEPSPKPITTRS